MTDGHKATLDRWAREERSVEVLGWSHPSAIGGQLVCRVDGIIVGILRCGSATVSYQRAPHSLVPTGGEA